MLEGAGNRQTSVAFRSDRTRAGRSAVAKLNLSCRADSYRWRRPAEDPQRTRFHALPLLEIDGEAISQSNAINRYVGRLTNLYPDDVLEAARCDEVMDAVEDIGSRVVATFGIEDEAEKKAAREELVDGAISLYLQRMQELLQARGGEYFADGRLTIADLKVLVWIRSIRSGRLDYVPVDLVDRVAPDLVKHSERVDRHPGIAAYYDAR